MTLQQSLHEFVRDELDVSVHDARLPTRPMMPAVVQRYITGSTVPTHSGRRSLLERRIQFDLYAHNQSQTDAMATDLLYALDGYHGPLGDVDIGWTRLIVDLEAPPQELTGKGMAPEVRFHRILDFAVGYQELPITS